MTKNHYRGHVVHNEYDKVAQIQVACGGVNVGNGSNCISWQKGQTEWKEYALTHHMRAMGQAATMADGSILLLGGQVDPNCMGKSARAEGNCTGWATDQTVERVTPGKSEVVFSIKHGDNKNGCAVQPVPGGEVVLLGGGACFFCRGSPHAHVERYDQTGHLGSLPDLLTPRWEDKSNTFVDQQGTSMPVAFSPTPLASRCSWWPGAAWASDGSQWIRFHKLPLSNS